MAGSASLRGPRRSAVLDGYLLAIDHLNDRLTGLSRKLEEMSREAPYAEPVAALRCFRGIDTLTAITIVAELHTFGRIPTPRGLMAFLGLVPSENSSGQSKQRGGITKAGTSHVRRVLVETAWNYRHRPGTAKLKRRREGQPSRVIAIADRAMSRLYSRYAQMPAARVPAPKITVAIARELVGFIWAVPYPMHATRAH